VLGRLYGGQSRPGPWALLCAGVLSGCMVRASRRREGRERAGRHLAFSLLHSLSLSPCFPLSSSLSLGTREGTLPPFPSFLHSLSCSCFPSLSLLLPHSLPLSSPAADKEAHLSLPPSLPHSLTHSLTPFLLPSLPPSLPPHSLSLYHSLYPSCPLALSLTISLVLSPSASRHLFSRVRACSLCISLFLFRSRRRGGAQV
jgi:hypothetical protein